MSVQRAFVVFSCAAVVAVLSAVGVLAQGSSATQPAPQRVRVETTVVKPEMIDAWQQLVRTEAIPAQKKAGVSYRFTFAAGGPVGPGFTYITVTPVANFAQFDQGSAIQRALGEQGAAKYNAKVRPMLVSTSALVQTLVAQVSLDSGMATPPPLIRIQNVQLLPGKGQEWNRITAEEYLPAFKKIGVRDYWVYATNYGGSTLLRTIVTPVSKWADLDQPGPLARALGQEASQKINQRRDALTANSEAIVARFLPELSFGTPPRSTSTQ
jgi:hypothetical protein